jgi:hypothetical protein
VPTADEFRRLAAECVELAPKISPDLRTIFIALAQGWANLADFLDEDHSVLPAPPPTEAAEKATCDTDGNGKDWVE